MRRFSCARRLLGTFGGSKMPLGIRAVTREFSFIEWLTDQISSPAFYLPLYSTISAAIVLLIVQRVGRKGAEGTRKVYGATYMLDTLYREFHSSCILLRQTVELLISV